MKTMQVFGCDDLGRELYSRFLQYGDGQYGNDCYISVYMDEYFYCIKEENPYAEWMKSYSDSTMFDVCAKLADCGATDNHVLMEHSW